MIELRHISKKYKDFTLDNISFSVDSGDYFVLLGESGAGKSLILEIIAGLIVPDKGEITLDGRNITNQKIQKRNIGLVFQDYTVFPHLTVKNNIAYTGRKNGYWPFIGKTAWYPFGRGITKSGIGAYPGPGAWLFIVRRATGIA